MKQMKMPGENEQMLHTANRPRKAAPAMPAKSLDALYRQPLAAKRTGALYGAFPYPTKISPEAIALYIAAHTKPGDTVFDGFGGSGTTGTRQTRSEEHTSELQSLMRISYAVFCLKKKTKTTTTKQQPSPNGSQ